MMLSTASAACSAASNIFQLASLIGVVASRLLHVFRPETQPPMPVMNNGPMYGNPNPCYNDMQYPPQPMFNPNNQQPYYGDPYGYNNSNPYRPVDDPHSRRNPVVSDYVQVCNDYELKKQCVIREQTEMLERLNRMNELTRNLYNSQMPQQQQYQQNYNNQNQWYQSGQQMYNQNQQNYNNQYQNQIPYDPTSRRWMMSYTNCMNPNDLMKNYYCGTLQQYPQQMYNQNYTQYIPTNNVDINALWGDAPSNNSPYPYAYADNGPSVYNNNNQSFNNNYGYGYSNMNSSYNTNQYPYGYSNNDSSSGFPQMSTCPAYVSPWQNGNDGWSATYGQPYSYGMNSFQNNNSQWNMMNSVNNNQPQQYQNQNNIPYQTDSRRYMTADDLIAFQNAQKNTNTNVESNSTPVSQPTENNNHAQNNNAESPMPAFYIGNERPITG